MKRRTKTLLSKRRIVHMKKLVKIRWILTAILLVSVLGIPQKVDAASKKASAVKAYASLLKKNPSKYKEIGSQYYDASFKLPDLSYLDSFFLYDLDKNGVPELFTITYVNARWEIIRVYTWKNNKVRSYIFSNGAEAVFNNCHTANGAYSFSICKKGHIHNVFSGGMGSNAAVYKVSKKKLKQFLTYQESYGDSYYKSTITATKNGKEISAEKYNSSIKGCVSKTLKWYENNKGNRRKLKKGKCKVIK